MSDMIKTAQQCQTMTDVRAEVDRIDRLLVELIAQRQTYMGAAARIKTDRDQVYDGPRIEDIITKVLGYAQTKSLSADIAEPVWREMISRSIAYELDVWDETKA